MTLTKGLIVFGLETVGLAVATMVIVRLLRGRVSAAPRHVIAAVLSVVVLGVAIANLEPAVSRLHRAHATSVGPLAGTENCLSEDRSQNSIAFVRWLRRRIPPRAIYAVQTDGEPDLWCVTLVLLPRLLAFGTAAPQWIVTFGTSSPQVQAQIARHAPSVQQFAPGYVLIRVPA